ncbi:MAG TPA: hypothetical protein VK745_02060 [Polyangiaceae bacterium]|nr:hypothetical protein [Polyangiaceae bacterium]
MSGTRLPTRPQPGLGESDDLDDLEELGDDAIIAQQTAAHAPQPRAIVSEESRSVVISDHPPLRDTQPPRSATFPKSTGEPTLIIRDRRALEEMRQQIVERQLRSKNRRSRSIYVWGALGLAAFVLGGIVAFLATDSHSDAPLPTADSPAAAPGRVEAQIDSTHASASVARAPSTAAGQAVRLDDLPVEAPKKK